MKYKKTIITFSIIILFYFYVLFNANYLETLATFPGTGLKSSENLRNYKKEIINFEEINIKDKKGNNINGLYMTGTSQKTVYYFHGNGASLDFFYPEIKYINDLGYSVLAYDYPGYGKSTGFPYKENVDDFSKNFFDYVKKEKNIENKNLIIWGYSIGTAVATDFASKNEFDKLVLFAPFSSRYEMSKKLFCFSLQKYLFLPNSYKTSHLVKNFKNPVLIIQGNKDKVIPISQGKQVFQNYLGEKHFIEIDGAGHNYLVKNNGYSLKNIISGFIDGKKLDFQELFLDQELKKTFEKLNEIADNNEKYSQIETLTGETQKPETNTLTGKIQKINISNTNTGKINQEKTFLYKFDFKTDDSITKYVSSKVSFNDLKYIPNDLEKITGEYLIDAKGNSKLRKKALENLQKMSEDFYKNFGTKIKIVSAYRSYEYQVGIKKGGCSDKFCSKAGYSEHQTGLAFDLFETTNEKEFLSKSNLKKYFDWLNKNAYKYGFTNSYKNGIEVDTYENEPWHWRYVGVDFATYLQENDLSFGKFMKKSGVKN